MVEIIHKRGWDSKVFDTGRVQVKEGELARSIYSAKLQNGLHDQIAEAIAAGITGVGL